jgi:hypothetical protein
MGEVRPKPFGDMAKDEPTDPAMSAYNWPLGALHGATPRPDVAEPLDAPPPPVEAVPPPVPEPPVAGVDAVPPEPCVPAAGVTTTVKVTVVGAFPGEVSSMVTVKDPVWAGPGFHETTPLTG